ncbi:MAG: HEAT repeat domain-containing protein [Alkalinema sp. RL_2_19]|nr:HEAT repeat domain-containing protein [Alkalinema sp. RL_2_19]
MLDCDETRAIAAQILAQMRHREAVPLLIALSRDANPTIRATAIDALSGFHAPQIAPILLGALTDHASAVRLRAVRGVGFCLNDLPNTDWLPYLEPLLSDLDLQVSRQAALTLGRLGTVGAVQALAAVLRSPHTPDQLAIDVIRALCWMERTEAMVELGQIWSTTSLSQPLRQAICQNFGQVETAAIRVQVTGLLIGWLESDADVARSFALQQAIITALGLLGDRQSVDLLIQQLAVKEPRLQLHLIASLKQIDATLAHERLVQVAASSSTESSTTSSTDQLLQRAAMLALQEW